MFTKEDFQDYFEQILVMERQMKAIYRRLHQNVQHPEYKEIFSRFEQEEAGHEALVEELKQAFQ